MVNRRLHGKQAQPDGYQEGPEAGVKVTAAQLQGWYGPRLSQPPLSEAKSPYLLHRRLCTLVSCTLDNFAPAMLLLTVPEFALAVNTSPRLFAALGRVVRVPPMIQ